MGGGGGGCGEGAGLGARWVGVTREEIISDVKLVERRWQSDESLNNQVGEKCAINTCPN